MKGNIWASDRSMMATEEIMAYVVSKIASCAWLRVDMFLKDRLYENPPMLLWRFTKDTSQDIYDKLNACVSDFSGQVKWVMNKTNNLRGEPGRNYCIEPLFVWEVHQEFGFREMPRILESQYRHEMEKVLEDIVPLAEYIEKEFDIFSSEPILPTIEQAEQTL